MQIDTPEKIIIDGTEYSVENFSENIKRLVAVHTKWRQDVATERLAVAKTEAAIRNLEKELTEMVVKELDEKSKSTVTQLRPLQA